MHALGQLIEDCKAVNRWTNGDIARQSQGRVTRTRVQQLEKDPIRAMPSLRVIEGLARGLRVPGWVIVGTVLESMGYPARPSRVNVDEAIDSDPSLSDEQRTALRAYLAGLRANAQMEVVSDGKPQSRRQATQQAGSAPKYQGEPPQDDRSTITEEWLAEQNARGNLAGVVRGEAAEDAEGSDEVLDIDPEARRH